MSAIPELADIPEVLLPKLPPTPYPGLRPFEKSEWPIFFGRERMTNEIVEQLMQRQFVFVHGASGSGKSSLVQAGVQAHLEQTHARSSLRWHTCAMRPGGKPLANLAEALSTMVKDRAGSSRIDFRRALNSGPLAPGKVAELLAIGEADRVCILLDQFEELFRFAAEVSRAESALLTDFLVAFQRKPPAGIYVLLTMRSEFLGECARFDGLAETINRTQYLLPRMDTNDLLRAVREPAALYGGRVSERLAERLIADAHDGQDELPLIQHGLARLWHFATPGRGIQARPVLDLPDYDARGPLGRLLSDHADNIADEVAGDPEGQLIVAELFRALTDINAGGNAIRRPQTFARLVAAAGTTAERLRAVIDAFRKPGASFVTPYQPGPIGVGTTIDISHEALIRRWQRIADPVKGWLQREFRDGLIWRSLLVQAESFAADNRNLLTEATVEARREWLKGRNEAWALRYGGQWALVGQLIAASRQEVKRQRKHAAAERKQAEQLRLEQARAEAAERLSEEQGKRAEAEAARAAYKEVIANRRQWQTWIAAGAALLMLGLAYVAYQGWNKATVVKDQALVQAQVAEFTATREADERKKTEDALAAEREASKKLQAALELASRTQTSSAGVVAETLSSESPEAAFARISGSLQKTTDPYQVAVLGQSIADFAAELSPEQIREATQVLVQALERTTDTSAVGAIGQALRKVVQSLTTEQTQAALDPVLESISRTNDPDQMIALATVVQSIVPKLPPQQVQEAAQAIILALSPAAQTFTSEQAQVAIDPILDSIGTGENSEQVTALARTLRELAPKLTDDQAEAAVARISSLRQVTMDATLASELDLATKALTARATAVTQVTLLVCIGDSVGRIGRCPPEAIRLPCGSSLADLPPGRCSKLIDQKNLAQSKGGECGYSVTEVRCVELK